MLVIPGLKANLNIKSNPQPIAHQAVHFTYPFSKFISSLWDADSLSISCLYATIRKPFIYIYSSYLIQVAVAVAGMASYAFVY